MAISGDFGQFRLPGNFLHVAQGRLQQSCICGADGDVFIQALKLGEEYSGLQASEPEIRAEARVVIEA